MIEKIRKKNKLKIIFLIIIFLILVFILIGILVAITRRTSRAFELNEVNQSKNGVNSNFIINLTDNEIVYNKELNIDININNFEEESTYKVEIRINNIITVEEEINSQNTFKINLENEGENDINVLIYKNTEKNYNNTFKIYYIKQYEKQFLDENSTKGVNAHYIDGTWENYEKSLEILKNAGVKYIRAGVKWESIEKNNNEYDFSSHDNWINQANKDGINIILNFTGMGNLIGNDKRIDSEEELERFLGFATKTINRYNNIKYFELFNEPNLDYNNWYYTTDYYFPWYARTFSRLTDIINQDRKDAQVSIGSTANILTGYYNNKNNLSSVDFFNKLIDSGLNKYINAFSFHIYDNENHNLSKFKDDLYTQRNNINNNGGFIYLDITEYGTSSFGEITEEMQASQLIKETIILDKSNVRIQTIYNSWNVGTDNDNKEHNFGLLHNDYTPKLSYYAMKNYYENTNGAEYIGTVNLADGLEAHVYDKDGKPKIIAWKTSQQATYMVTK